MRSFPLDRRSFLSLAAGATAALAGIGLPGCLAAGRRQGALQAAGVSPLRSVDGLLELDLTAQESAVSIPRGAGAGPHL
ncbi:MAG: hypothetical protein ACKO5F_06785 [Synechococcus sp.]